MDRFILTLEQGNPKLGSEKLVSVRLGKRPAGWYTGSLESRLPESCEGWVLDCSYSFIVDDKYRYRK